MKKLFQISFALLAVVMLASSCSSLINKTAGGARSRFAGTWVLNNVGYERLINNTVQKVFDQAPPTAFVGSTWTLTNSGNGQYALTDGTIQSIFWSYYNPGNGVEPSFQFKKVYQGDKPKNVGDGYRLNIGSADATGMILKSPVNMNGSIGYVVYSFTKTK